MAIDGGLIRVNTEKTIFVNKGGVLLRVQKFKACLNLLMTQTSRNDTESCLFGRL
jgi:hypothetical protein